MMNMSLADAMATGRYGFNRITGTGSTPVGKTYAFIYCPVDTVINTCELADGNPPADNDLNGVTIFAGTWLTGVFKDILLTSGEMYCYYDKIYKS